jgi:hypothetical protein
MTTARMTAGFLHYRAPAPLVSIIHSTIAFVRVPEGSGIVRIRFGWSGIAATPAAGVLLQFLEVVRDV